MDLADLAENLNPSLQDLSRASACPSLSLVHHITVKKALFCSPAWLQNRGRRSAFFMIQLSHPYMTTGKTIALTRWSFVGKVMSLLFNILSRLVTAFPPRSNHLLISWVQSPSADFGAQEKKVCHCFHCFPIHLHLSDGTRCHDLSFLNVEF